MLEEKSSFATAVPAVEAPEILEVVTRNVRGGDLAVEIHLAARSSDPVVYIGVLTDDRGVGVEQAHPVEHFPSEAAEIHRVHAPALPAQPELRAANTEGVRKRDADRPLGWWSIAPLDRPLDTPDIVGSCLEKRLYAP